MLDLSTIPGFVGEEVRSQQPVVRRKKKAVVIAPALDFSGMEAVIAQVEANLQDVPYGEAINYDVADGVLLMEKILRPDRTELMTQYKVGDRFVVKGEAFYECKRLVITAVDRVGLSTNDLDEVKSYLAVPVAHCIGWPTILAWREKGMCE